MLPRSRIFCTPGACVCHVLYPLGGEGAELFGKGGGGGGGDDFDKIGGGDDEDGDDGKMEEVMVVIILLSMTT